jgi:hypothetical protein
MVGRSDGRTVGRLCAAVVVLLSVSPTVRLSSQVSLRFSLGARYSTTLVHDSIVVPFDLRPAVAPTLALSVRDNLRGPWTGDATLDLSAAKLKRYESGTTTETGSFTAIAFTLGLRRELTDGVGARLGFGGLVYSTDGAGVFQRGNGGLFPIVALAASYAPRFAARHGLEVSVQYDLHRFITPALRSVGFGSARPVHRFALTVSGRLLGR